MLSPNKQLALEVMTVIILGSATFLAANSDRGGGDKAVRKMGLVVVTAEKVAPEAPQETRRDNIGI